MNGDQIEEVYFNCTWVRSSSPKERLRINQSNDYTGHTVGMATLKPMCKASNISTADNIKSLLLYTAVTQTSSLRRPTGAYYSIIIFIIDTFYAYR